MRSLKSSNLCAARTDWSLAANYVRPSPSSDCRATQCDGPEQYPSPPVSGADRHARQSQAILSSNAECRTAPAAADRSDSNPLPWLAAAYWMQQVLRLTSTGWWEWSPKMADRISYCCCRSDWKSSHLSVRWQRPSDWGRTDAPSVGARAYLRPMKQLKQVNMHDYSNQTNWLITCQAKFIKSIQTDWIFEHLCFEVYWNEKKYIPRHHLASTVLKDNWTERILNGCKIKLYQDKTP